MWYQEHIGGGTCPIVDTWWQTETGGIMISPLPGATTTKPGSATFPLPGVSAELIDDEGNRVDVGGGYLTLTRPWPGMLRGIWGDPDRFRETYWSRFEGRYFAGDGAKLDDDGYLWLLGRVDDVMNVSGHRISTTEVESALVSHPAVAEAAVVGANDATTGQAIIAYVILRGGEEVDAEVLRTHVGNEIGAIAKPKQIYITPDLPKTRIGQDHAPPASRCGRGPQHRRHHHAGRRVDRRRVADARRRRRRRLTPRHRGTGRFVKNRPRIGQVRLKQPLRCADTQSMGPPDGARANRLPTMSWESVVDEHDGSAAAPPDDAASPVVESTPAPASRRHPSRRRSLHSSRPSARVRSRSNRSPSPR